LKSESLTFLNPLNHAIASQCGAAFLTVATEGPQQLLSTQQLFVEQQSPPGVHGEHLQSVQVCALDSI
jgi:hypothetical protein